jgi:hypothetical protein
MYQLIERHRNYIVDSIRPSDIGEYAWLRSNRRHANTGEYQRRYRKYWIMNRAFLSAEYFLAYFEFLATAPARNTPFGNLPVEIYTEASKSNGVLSCQFSFASKLLHTLSTRRPVYDSRVAWFYFFTDPGASADVDTRTAALEGFYEFLEYEYARVLARGLLARSIALFRRKLGANAYTDEKIIDTLIWAFAGKAHELMNERTMQYQ